ASALMTWLLVDVLIAPGQDAPETRQFAPSAWLPTLRDILPTSRSPLNLAALIALLCCVAVWAFLWRTRRGYELRAVGLNETASRYAGIPVDGIRIVALCLGGACAGLVALNEVMGAQHRLLLDFAAGA